MKDSNPSFNEHEVLHALKHYLPAQAPLKDFIHHNTLHAFQNLNFFTALNAGSEMFGYKVMLNLHEYRTLYRKQRINEAVLRNVIYKEKGGKYVTEWLRKLTETNYDLHAVPRIGLLRANWKKIHHIDLDLFVQPILFRILCSYLDQGISIWNFPVLDKGFLESLRELEKNSFTSIFKKERSRKILLENHTTISDLLSILVGDESLFEQYLFDQQFTHQGWSGIVSAIEDHPNTLIDKKNISIHDLVYFELLLEIDAIDSKIGNVWSPLGSKINERPKNIFSPVKSTELFEVLTLWQKAFEWSYFDQVLIGLKTKVNAEIRPSEKSFQAIFCIDDRECSIRRYIEREDNSCETYGSPGFFGVEFFYQPEHGKSYTKLCPAPVTPKYLIKEIESSTRHKKDAHYSKTSNSLFRGWLISQTLGFWSAFQLFINIFKPSMSPATASSFKHMDEFSNLTIENSDVNKRENDLQIGFTIAEMVMRVENFLKGIGLVKDFAPIVYVVGHGSTSVNNTHYAGYDCGACSGRPGSVNARVISFMVNHKAVREILITKGIEIPDTTQFVGALHDTSRDEMAFYDKQNIYSENIGKHIENEKTFLSALDNNAKERSRRFESIDSKLSSKKIHQQILTRSVSLFEPRPELNHATNALCIVGRRELSKGLFLDRRSFMNSYDYAIDPEGLFLSNILNAVAPVCGGINLEYYFSRVDNQKLGAGTKLAHNVMGLFGVANGIDGDLRPGLPSQMTEVHDPLRLLLIVEHLPEAVLKSIERNSATYEWFMNDWIHLVAVHPESGLQYVFRDGAFELYNTINNQVETISNLDTLIESHQENFPVYLIQK
jgi:uncharacterized protein